MAASPARAYGECHDFFCDVSCDLPMSQPSAHIGQSASLTVGSLLRDWRQRRRLSQLALATEADVSQRHLSFVESGRAAPSREMLLRLAEPLQLPLRERNRLLMAGGYAPVYGEHDLYHPDAEAARRVVEMVLAGHAPYPALAVDRYWQLVMANPPALALLGNIAPSLLVPPVNVLRASLHPEGLASRVVNYREWRAHVLTRLAQQVDQSGDPVLAALAEELRALSVPANALPRSPRQHADYAGLAIPLELATDDGVLRLISTVTVFGTPIDAGVAELAIESFFPADPETAARLQALAP